MDFAGCWGHVMYVWVAMLASMAGGTAVIQLGDQIYCDDEASIRQEAGSTGVATAAASL